MRTLILLTLTLVFSVPVLGEQSTTASDIRQMAERFLQVWAEEQQGLGRRVAYQTGNVDRRLKLALCEGEPELEFASNPLRTPSPSILISCAGKRPWRMYVSASVEVYGPAIVAARPLTRGERLSSSALTTSEVQLNASRRGTLTDIQSIQGMLVRRPVKTGTVLTPDLLEAPDAIERGDHVIILARTGSFSVSSRGKALGNASIGEQVVVENLRSARTVKATVVAPGRVEIPMQ
ncbi:flagellar basal body P-ring formation chaperone FlgA [Marinobacter litoralis]|uniref:flagellar basal body P-ring formation chaperone FlgA n=1 Tax=Marinobacter litoralis TaxID=187981 RepID=UPI0018ECBE1F|nr:flagellar basal body P-ring formation chaperone FlgA [Marinobacter litoralis]MBJ6138003.1 flagellar basal body P-ring formation protein FlgA [Marinobacter litoralis]